MEALSEERERGEAAIERAVQRTTDIVQQGMTDLKKVSCTIYTTSLPTLGLWKSGFTLQYVCVLEL